MPASWKCPQCSLVNFASDQACKRCGAAQIVPTQTTPLSGGIVLDDGYIMPPPPSFGGVWREGSILVMAKDSPLPDNCVKCDAPAQGFRMRKRFSWHHPALYALVLVAWLIYLIVALSVRKQATVYVGMCQEHYQRRRNLLAAGWITFGLAGLAMIVGFSSEYPLVGFAGMLVLAAAAVFLAMVARVLNVKKIDDRYVWLSGFDEKFLARFPVVPQ